MYRDGVYIPQDDRQAARLYKLAADQGHSYSQYGLGVIYANGIGVSASGSESVLWLTRAANQGYDLAQGQLAATYSEGIGVPQDYVQAYKWYNIMSAQSTGGGMRHLRDELGRKMTPVQIAEAQRLSSEWKPRPESERALLDFLD